MGIGQIRLGNAETRLPMRKLNLVDGYIHIPKVIDDRWKGSRTLRACNDLSFCFYLLDFYKKTAGPIFYIFYSSNDAVSCKEALLSLNCRLPGIGEQSN